MLYISFLVDFKLYHYNCVGINRINTCETVQPFIPWELNTPAYLIHARNSQMWRYGRGNSGGSWLPEEKKS